MATRAPQSVQGGVGFRVVFAFHWETWCVFISAYLITALLIIFAARKVFHMISDTESPPNVFVAIFDQWLSLMTHKHHDKYLVLDFVRIAVACFSLASMVLASSYTGVLFSEKLKTSISLPYEDFESFVVCLEKKRCRIVVSTLSISFIQILLGPGSDLGRRASMTFDRNPPLIMPNMDAKKAIIEDQSTYLVWIGDKNVFETDFQSAAECKFYILETGYSEAWTFPIRKRSPLKPICDSVAVAFQDLGLQEGALLRYKRASRKCDPNVFNKRSRVSDSATTYAGLCLLAIGIGCGCFVLLTEVAIEWWRSKWNGAIGEWVG